MFIKIEGVATVAEVYINGNIVGCHKGVYTSFTFDITDSLTVGNNVISVRVDSTRRPDIPPEGHEVDYCLFGGIVRGVSLITTGAAYVENAYFTTPGLEESLGTSARLRSETTIVNTAEKPIEIIVETVLISEDNEIVAVSDSTEEIEAGRGFIFAQETDEIKNPLLWDTDNPHLYTVITRVLSEGELIDETRERIGFRWF